MFFSMMNDIFSIVFQESTFKNSKQTEPKFVFQPMSCLGIIYSIKVFTREKWKIVKNYVKISNYIFGPATKFKNLSNVHSILLGAVENDFQSFIQKESYEIASEL